MAAPHLLPPSQSEHHCRRRSRHGARRQPPDNGPALRAPDRGVCPALTDRASSGETMLVEQNTLVSTYKLNSVKIYLRSNQCAPHVSNCLQDL